MVATPTIDSRRGTITVSDDVGEEEKSGGMEVEAAEEDEG